MNLDELELELRKLPGIRGAAFSEQRDRLLVQLHSVETTGDDVALRATRVAARHSEKPVSVKVVCPSPAPRAKSRAKTKTKTRTKAKAKRAN